MITLYHDQAKTSLWFLHNQDKQLFVIRLSRCKNSDSARGHEIPPEQRPPRPSRGMSNTSHVKLLSRKQAEIHKTIYAKNPME